MSQAVSVVVGTTFQEGEGFIKRNKVKISVWPHPATRYGCADLEQDTPTRWNWIFTSCFHSLVRKERKKWVNNEWCRKVE